MIPDDQMPAVDLTVIDSGGRGEGVYRTEGWGGGGREGTGVAIGGVLHAHGVAVHWGSENTIGWVDKAAARRRTRYSGDGCCCVAAKEFSRVPWGSGWRRSTFRIPSRLLGGGT